MARGAHEQCFISYDADRRSKLWTFSQIIKKTIEKPIFKHSQNQLLLNKTDT